MLLGKRLKFNILPGTHPSPDATESDTLLYTDTDKVRFYNGKLRSVGGCQAITFGNSQTLSGCARMIYSYLSDNKNRVIIGTNTRLYTYQDGLLYNITPLLTTTTAIANSLATNYTTLANNPIATTNGSRDIIITHTAHKLQPSDSITLSGATTMNGVPDTDINKTHVVRSTTTNTFTIRVTTTATSTGSGGGAAVIEKTPIITVTAAAHGLPNGDRIKIAGAATTGGITNTEINAEHVIRNVTTNTFDIVVTGKATSSVSSGGGASTTYQTQITEGECDFLQGLGYGGGLYGAGLYGVAKTFTSAFLYPRIWSGARYGNNFVCTPGEGTGVYFWDNDTNTAPTALANAPTVANWVFVTNNAVAVLGADGVENRLKISDIGDAEDWTPAVDSYAYFDDLEGVGRLISQAKAKTTDLLFTENQVFTLRFVDKPDIWDVQDLLKNDGIIAPRARAEIEDAVFWMGGDDFYIFDGNSIDVLPNNTVKRYVYENFNFQQRWKIFCHANPEWSEVWWFYPSAASNEPDRYVIYNYREKHWTLGSWDRTAAEEPSHITQYPYLIDCHDGAGDGALYRHEYGKNDNTDPLSPFAESYYFSIGEGDTTMEILELVPDSTQEGNVDVTIYTKDKQQSSTERTFGPYPITSTTEVVDTRATGRMRKYRFSQDALNESFITGKWFETVREGTPR